MSNFNVGKLESISSGFFFYGIEDELELEGEDGYGGFLGRSPIPSPLP
jgi:hypothetical protein